MATIGAGLAGSFGSDGNFASGVAAAETGKNAVENNLLSNQEGVKNLDEKGKALYEKLKAAGVEDVEKYQEELEKCNGDSECESNVRNTYHVAVQNAGKIIYNLYITGELTDAEFWDLRQGNYQSAMMNEAIEGNNNIKSDMWNNIFRLSGYDWIPAGLAGNRYIEAVRIESLARKWEEAGYSQEKIEKLRNASELVASMQGQADVSKIAVAIDAGLNKEEIILILGAALAGKYIGKNTSKGALSKLTPEMETKILEGQRIDGSNKVIGGHYPNINDTNPKYAV